MNVSISAKAGIKLDAKQAVDISAKTDATIKASTSRLRPSRGNGQGECHCGIVRCRADYC